MKIERYQSIINIYLKYNAIHVRDYIYIYIYIHTHTHTHIHIIEYVERERERKNMYIYIESETGKEKMNRDMEKTYIKYRLDF